MSLLFNFSRIFYSMCPSLISLKIKKYKLRVNEILIFFSGIFLSTRSLLIYLKLKKCVSYRVSERAAAPCITPTVKHWRRLWYGMRDLCQLPSRDLHQVKGKVNQTGYHSTLRYYEIPSGTQRLVGQVFVLIQDNEPKHTSKLCQTYIKSKEEQNVLPLISRLAQSADLNPIELVWDEFDQKVRTKQATSLANFWQFLQESWEELSSVYL